MILKSERYLSAYNEYCEVNVERAHFNMKLIIGIRESRTGNWILVLYLRKRLGYFKTVKSETGNREPATISLFLILEKYITLFYSILSHNLRRSSGNHR